jgi:hypothetical protein
MILIMIIHSDIHKRMPVILTNVLPKSLPNCIPWSVAAAAIFYPLLRK